MIVYEWSVKIVCIACDQRDEGCLYGLSIQTIKNPGGNARVFCIHDIMSASEKNAFMHSANDEC